MLDESTYWSQLIVTEALCVNNFLILVHILSSQYRGLTMIQYGTCSTNIDRISCHCTIRNMSTFTSTCTCMFVFLSVHVLVDVRVQIHVHVHAYHEIHYKLITTVHRKISKWWVGSEYRLVDWFDVTCRCCCCCCFCCFVSSLLMGIMDSPTVIQWYGRQSMEKYLSSRYRACLLYF